MPPAALVGRLRGAIPPTVGIELVFDGQPERGLRGERIASGLVVRHSGRRTADELIVQLVQDARAAAGPRGADNVLVITDDAELRGSVSALGAQTTRSPWLVARLARERIEGPATGNPRPPRAPRSSEPAGPGPRPGPGPEEDAPGWRPGRGATKKRGNPRRRPRHG